MSLLVCNVTTPSWQWQFRLCVALQWAVGGAFPIKINFLCSLGMVGWKVSLWSSARQAYFISPGRKQVSQISLLTRRLWGKRHDFWIQAQSIFPNRNLFPRSVFLGWEWMEFTYNWVSQSGIWWQFLRNYKYCRSREQRDQALEGEETRRIWACRKSNEAGTQVMGRHEDGKFLCARTVP